jgi:two-component system response regulator FixJ
MSVPTLYIVDDDDDVRLSLRSLLSQPPLHVEEFETGGQFLTAMPDLAPGCVLLDLNMRHVPGMDVLAAIAQSPDRFATVIHTGKGDVALAVQAMKCGAIDFLEKPCDPAILIDAVTRAFDRLAHRRREMARHESARAKLATLSSREFDVFRCVIDGLSNKLIAYQLDISPRTVEIHRAKVMDKLDVRTLSEAMRVAFAAGLIFSS